MASLAAVDSSTWAPSRPRGTPWARPALAELHRGVSLIGDAIAAAVPAVLRDLSGVSGAALVAYGMWLIYPPCGFITGGLFLLTGSFLSAKA